jgi:hypothetical protein
MVQGVHVKLNTGHTQTKEDGLVKKIDYLNWVSLSIMSPITVESRLSELRLTETQVNRNRPTLLIKPWRDIAAKSCEKRSANENINFFFVDICSVVLYL